MKAMSARQGAKENHRLRATSWLATKRQESAKQSKADICKTARMIIEPIYFITTASHAKRGGHLHNNDESTPRKARRTFEQQHELLENGWQE